MKNGFREWCVEDMTIEIGTSASGAGISGKVGGVVNLRRRFNERNAIAEGKEMSPPADI